MSDGIAGVVSHWSMQNFVSSNHDSDYTDDDGDSMYLSSGSGGGDYSKSNSFVPVWMRRRLNGVWSALGRLYDRLSSLSWIVTTSMLLLALPVLFVYDREKNSSEQQLMLPSDGL